MRTTTATIVLAAALAAGCAKPPAAPAGPPPVPVRTVTPTVADVTVWRDYPGSTLSVRTVEVFSRVPGWVNTQGFKDGQLVDEGAFLYEIDPRPFAIAVERAKADLAQVEADLANAHVKVERNRPLVPVQAISQQDFDQLVANERALEASRLAKTAALDQAKLDLSFTRITSPGKGQASNSNVDPGTYVTSQVRLTNIMQLDPIWVEFRPIAAEIPVLRRLAETSSAATEATMPGADWKRTGKVVFIDNAVEPATSTIRARIEVPNPDRSIAPGAYVNVRFPSEELKGAVSVPEAAIVYETAAATAWVLEADGTARQRVLRTGPRGGAGIVVVEGIRPGDRVVVEGMQKLHDGAKTIDADQMRQMMQGKAPPAPGAAGKPGGAGDAAAPAEGAAR